MTRPIHPAPTRDLRAAATRRSLSMTIGRAAAARTTAEVAAIGAGDRLVDIGCGPRHRHARGGAPRGRGDRGRPLTADARPGPPDQLRARAARYHLGRRLGRGDRSSRRPPWLGRSAPSTTGRTVSAGLAEASRVLARGGLLVLAERLTRRAYRPRAGTTSANCGIPPGADSVTLLGGPDQRRRRRGWRSARPRTRPRPDP